MDTSKFVDAADLAALRAPIPVNRIKWRVGATNRDKSKGMALAYIDARVLQDRLDDTVGIENWQNEIVQLHGGTYICRLGIRVQGEWIWKSDGAGATDFEPEKGACSDAFKRSGVQWGVGRELYALDSIWVAIEESGRGHKIKKGEFARLNNSIGNASQPAAEPEAPEPESPEPEAPKEDPDERQELFDQVKELIGMYDLDETYVRNEMGRRTGGRRQMASDIKTVIGNIKEHPELWRDPDTQGPKE